MISQRSQVAPFHVMEVIKAAAARQDRHGDVILLCVGQPSTPAPEVARRAVVEAMTADVLGYSEAVGRRDCRAAVAEHYARTYELAIDPDEVVLTVGSSGGFVAALLAAFDVGDAVAMAVPGYPAYRNTIEALGLRFVGLDCGPATRFQPTIEQLDAIDPAPRGLVVASPANPTGTVIGPAELAAIVGWCDDHDCVLISDEIYHGITYGAACTSAWETSRQSVVIGSLSKYFSMTGYRIGWMLAPAELRRAVELLQGNLSICAPAISQVAAAAALGPAAGEELRGHVERYAANRQILLDRLPELGIHSIAPPDGAFYIYADIGHLTDDSLAWTAAALDATGVAIAPGIDFDPVGGQRSVRFSFCAAPAEIHEAFDRLVRWVG